MPSEKIYAHLLGTMTFYVDEQALLLPDSLVGRRLLAYLILHRDRTHARSVVIGLFWPDISESRARRALSQALWHIRQRFPNLIETSNETITISDQAAIWTDIENFEALVKPHLTTGGSSIAYSDIEKGLQLYRGDLLEGIYDDWALLERERYHELYLRGLEKFSQLEKSAGNYAHALEIIQKLLQINPLQESIHREAMRLYYKLGKPNAAMRQYETCCKILQDEFVCPQRFLDKYSEILMEAF
ncbi:MAG: hypothetical protein HN855_04355 [Anaerolineae bacterium]|jgi:DNA-binding SARP family transcriptional activator|nr:hypothetical protein [Anaerolineae bacterium]MBT7324368.1 hypothetical protein [Anaerolineae bacterium]